MGSTAWWCCRDGPGPHAHPLPRDPPADALSIVVDLFYLTAYNWAASQLVRNRSNRLCAITFGIAWSWAASRLVEPRAYLSGPEAQCKRDTPPPWACEELLAAIEAVPDRFAYERSLLGALHDVGHEPVPDDAQANPDTLATHVLPRCCSAWCYASQTT